MDNLTEFNKVAMTSKKIIADFIYFQLKKLNWQDENHCFASAGFNGPHFNLETPVRNTCHWLVTMIIANNWLEDKEISKTITAMANWLLENNPYYLNGAYKMRQHPGGDCTNGVIGPSWILECLIRLNKYKADDRTKNRADEMINKLTFSKNIGLWHRFDPFTNNKKIDYTYDHQVWLAAVLAEFGKFENVDLFLNKSLGRLMQLRKNGLINHVAFAVSMKGLLLWFIYLLRQKIDKVKILSLEKSYHHYVLFGLARIKHFLPENKIFTSYLLRQALEYQEQFNINEYIDLPLAISYNSPGFEFPLIGFEFRKSFSTFNQNLSNTINWQIKHTFNTNRNSCLNAKDPINLTARIYELTLFVEYFSSIKECVE